MNKIKVFYSYSHENEAYRIELEKWLTILRNENYIEEWHDRKILPGDNWNSEIDEHKDKADIILLLFSQDFISSSACEKEMKYAIRKQKEKKIIPIILKRCTWHDLCGDIQALPKDGKPIDEWDKEEKAWENIYEEIKKVVNCLRESFNLKSDFEKDLNKTEFISQSKEHIFIDDIFIFPNIRQSSIHIEEENEVDSIETFVNNENKYMTLIGDDLSGKTSICKQIFKKSIQMGYNPILLDGEMIFKSKNFEEIIKKAFNYQFTGDYRIWKEKRKKIVIVDNYHHKISSNIIEFLKSFFDRIIIVINFEEYLVYFKDESVIADFDLFTIKALSYVKQEKLIRKWKTLSDEKSITKIEDIEIDQIEEKLDSIISKSQIVPRYPFYILSILQSLEAFMPADYKVTAYGHCYHALITAQLLKKNIKPDDLDSCFNFLMYLSYKIFVLKQKKIEFTKLKYNEFLKEYEKRFIISKNIVRKIINNEYPIIRFHDFDNIMKFEYPYVYFYFLGQYFSENPDKKLFEKMCREIYLKEYAFLLIFIIHHAKNQELIDEILLHCMCFFEDSKPAQLDKEETIFMNTLILELPKSILSSDSTETHREKERLLKDKGREVEDKEIEEENTAKNIHKALKIIEIIGQIIKNRSGSFEKLKIIEMIEEVQELGLRVLSYFLRNLKSDDFEMWLHKRLEAEENKLEKRKKIFDEKKKNDFIKMSIQFIAFIIIMGILGKIVSSISSKKLSYVINEIAEKHDTPAYKLINIFVHVSQTSIDIKELRKTMNSFLKTNNKWASKTLSLYVQSFLNLHTIPYIEKQKICSLLNIRYKLK